MMDDLQGRTFAHYRVLGPLGSGGMGMVYKAEDTKLGRVVALKFPPSEIVSAPSLRERFMKEARAASALDHTNICNVHAIEETADGDMFIVMAYYDGDTLKERIKQGPLPPIEAVEITSQCAEGLTCAHERGIVHRDIKPANLIRLEDGVVKILDFGVAKLAPAEALPQRFVDSGEHHDDPVFDDRAFGPHDSTLTHMVLGTPAYMAPEQTRPGSVDHRADIWSLGVTLYEMISGRPPFQGESLSDIIQSIRHHDPEPLRAIQPDTPVELERIVNKAITKRPEDRYQQIDSMLVDLSLLRQHLRSGSNRKESAPDGPSIAVMPFENLSDEKEQEYFCDGMTDEIIGALTRVEGLRVVARSTVFSFKGRKMDVREAGNQLGVGVVLEGSVRKVGNMLRIAVQLVNVDSGANLWSERYNRELEDVFAIQEDIAEAIVSSQAVRHLRHDSDRATTARRHTRNIEAYNLYLKGRFHWNKRTTDALHTAVEYFENAISLDPAYALAYAGLADCQIILGYYGTEAPAAIFPKAKANAVKAISLDKTLAEAHTSLAFVTLLYDWDWSSAERCFTRALTLDPGYPTAHHWYAEYLTFVGRMDEAVDIAKGLVALDPLSPIILTLVGWVHFYKRDYDAAIDILEDVLRLDDDFVPGRLWLGLSQEKIQSCDVAATTLKRAVEIESDNPAVLSALGRILAACGNPDKARTYLQQLRDNSAKRHVPAYHIAALHAALGETEETFCYLEEAHRQRDPWLLFLRIDPVWDALREESGFIEMVRRVGLP
jgi:serine/threonine protein kinase/tetratricopeptide (TPR) repeat protein